MENTSVELIEERRTRSKANNVMQATSRNDIENSIVRNPNATARIAPVQYVSMAGVKLENVMSTFDTVFVAPSPELEASYSASNDVEL